MPQKISYVPLFMHGCIALPGEVSLLRSLITDSIPPGFRPEVTPVGSVVNVQPALWNSGDSLTLQIVADGSSNQVDVAARISGIRQIDSSLTEDSQDRHRAYLALALGTLGMFGYSFFAVAGLSSNFRRVWSSIAVSFAAAGLFMILSSSIMLRYAADYFKFAIADSRQTVALIVLILIALVMGGFLLGIRLFPHPLLARAAAPRENRNS